MYVFKISENDPLCPQPVLHDWCNKGNIWLVASVFEHIVEQYLIFV